MRMLRHTSRRYMLAAMAGFALVISSVTGAIAQASEDTADWSGPRWVATWGTPPMPNGSTFGESRSFENQTVRQIVRVSAGGTHVRVKLSNEYGVGDLIVGSAHVALQSSGAAIVPESDRALTFRGQTSVVIPQGAVVLSDPVTLTVPSNTSLSISLYVPQNTGYATYHHNGNQTAYISGPGDFTNAVDLAAESTSTSRFWLTFVEVLSPRKPDVLAIFGDSLSEGATTTLDADRRVSDVLSRMFNPQWRPARLAVLNQSTGCGRLLTDFCGPSGLSRFDREVLNARGISKVLLALGYVDIIYPTAFGVPDEIVSAEQIITGLRQLIRRARMRGLEVYGATLPPNGSTPFGGVYTPENEAKRQAVNRWIRTTRELDGVADYDLVLRDPDDHTRLLEEYDSSDGIHPDDEGHAAMARAIAHALRDH